MNLLLAIRKIWQYKLITLPIIALTLAGAYYVVVVKSPVYESTSSFILVNPPEPPTLDEIERDPSLADVKSDNPYTMYSDQSVVAQVLASRLSSDAARRDLERSGADSGFIIQPSVEYGFTVPVVEITGTGPTAAAAIRTAKVLNTAARQELDRMQSTQGVAPKYRIDTQPVVVPHDAQLKASGKLRMLVVVFALGAILLFVAITVAEAIRALRRERPTFPSDGTRYLPPGPTPPGPTPNGGVPALPDSEPKRREVTLWIPDPPRVSGQNGHASTDETPLVETIKTPTANGDSNGSSNGAANGASNGALVKVSETARRLWQEARKTTNE